MIFNRQEEINKLLERKKQEIEKRDYELFLKRSKKYIPINIRERQIITEFGKLSFKRRIYKYFENGIWKRISFIDEEFGLIKKSKYDINFIKKIEMQLGSGKRYQDIIDMFPESNISSSFISKIFKAVENDYKRNLVKEKVKLDNKQIIYIFIDDTFINTSTFNQISKIKANGKYKETKIRVISFCTGLENINKFSNRKKTVNKRISFLLGKDEMVAGLELANKVIELGCNFYDNFKNSKIVIGGDGATWIKQLAKTLNGEYILDKYHAIKILRDSILFSKLNNSEIIFDTALNYFFNGMYEDLMKILITFSSDKVIKFFKVRKQGVINQKESWNIGVSAESDISRLVKSTLGYGNRIYNPKVLKNILNEKAYKINNN